MRILVEVGRFFVTAAAVTIVMPFFFIVLFAFEGGELAFTVYGFGLIVAFPFAVFGGMIFGLPAWFIANRMAWTQKLSSMLALGAATGILAVTAVFFTTGPHGDPFPLVAGLVLGLPAGVLAAWIWFVLHAEDRDRTSA